jgi:hypothetical protein
MKRRKQKTDVATNVSELLKPRRDSASGASGPLKPASPKWGVALRKAQVRSVTNACLLAPYSFRLCARSPSKSTRLTLLPLDLNKASFYHLSLRTFKTLIEKQPNGLVLQ